MTPETNDIVVDALQARTNKAPQHVLPEEYDEPDRYDMRDYNDTEGVMWR